MFKNTQLIGLCSLIACFFSVGVVTPVLSQSQEYPTQVATAGDITWELKSCTRKQNNVVSCIFSVSRGADAPYAIHLNNETKLVDSDGNEYHASKAESLKKVAGPNSDLNFNMVKDVQYKVTIDFSDVPNSVRYTPLLQISVGVIGFYSFAQYRNVPFINLDGSLPVIPRSNRSPVNSQPSNTNNSTPRRKVCLPIVGCL